MTYPNFGAINIYKLVSTTEFASIHNEVKYLRFNIHPKIKNVTIKVSPYCKGADFYIKYLKTENVTTSVNNTMERAVVVALLHLLSK